MKDERKIKHLELIQGVINRLNSNSFTIKGWAILLISSLFALAAKDTLTKYAYITYIPTLMSWLLDGYFLSHERRFRSLFDKVRIIPDSKIDFSMNTEDFNKKLNRWWPSINSTTLRLFYCSLLILTSIILLLSILTQQSCKHLPLTCPYLDMCQ